MSFEEFLKENDNLIKHFIGWIKSTNNEEGFKRPFKCYAIITILEYWRFNSDINLNQDFFKFYGSLNFNDPILKIRGIVNGIKISGRTPRTHFLDLPFSRAKGRIQNGIFEIVENKIICKMNILEEYFKLFKSYICNLVYEITFQRNVYGDRYTPTKYRIHQSEWAELIKEQNNYRCVICGLKSIELLEAAHIVPVTNFIDPDGKDSNECYSKWNGLTLCANHHKMFDKCLKLRKENNYYVFDIKNNVSEETKIEILSILDEFTLKINQLINKNSGYIPYFDLLCIID